MAKSQIYFGLALAFLGLGLYDQRLIRAGLGLLVAFFPGRSAWRVVVYLRAGVGYLAAFCVMDVVVWLAMLIWLGIHTS